MSFEQIGWLFAVVIIVGFIVLAFRDRKNWVRALKREKKDDHSQDAVNYYKKGLDLIKGHTELPTPLPYDQRAEAVIALPYATVSVTPNFDVQDPRVILTVAEIFDPRNHQVNVTRIELSGKEAGRLARAMNSAGDWASGLEEG